jgi:hypothetical protein
MDNMGGEEDHLGTFINLDKDASRYLLEVKANCNKFGRLVDFTV